MKKLVFATALAFGSLTMGTAASPIIFHDGIMEEVMSQDFKEIAVADVPAAITEAMASDYAGATIYKAYVDESNNYKLEASMEDGSAMVLYADAEGNWLEM